MYSIIFEKANLENAPLTQFHVVLVVAITLFPVLIRVSVFFLKFHGLYP